MHIKHVLFYAAVAWVILTGAALSENRRVLIVHSMPPGFAWVQGINAAIKERFAQSDIEYDFFYMDTYANACEVSRKKICAKARERVASYKPHVVIAVDDDAQKYLVRYYAGKSAIQFVFCGVNAHPETYGYPAPNVTGILERTYTKQALELLMMIKPGITTAIGISDDSSTSREVSHRLKRNNTRAAQSIRLVDVVQLSTFSQWMNIVEYYDDRPDIGSFLIPLTDTIKQDWDQQNMSPAEIMMWTSDNVTKPIVGLWPSAPDHGALCAVVVDPKEHGTVAALMTKKILAGTPAGQIPMVVNRDGYVIINLKAADILNIDVPFSVLQSADRIIQ